jgi:putative transcriptional regulator
MVLRNRVKELRARHNINQAELGKLVEASRQTISLIERGDYSPSVLLALRIAMVLKVNVEEVFYLEEENKYEKV